MLMNVAPLPGFPRDKYQDNRYDYDRLSFVVIFRPCDDGEAKCAGEEGYRTVRQPSGKAYEYCISTASRTVQVLFVP